ncbi:MAG: DUF3304 domain-containing protein [Aquabacterium sp.]|nr:DUF3304 domain-containing protein [Aquabacterium sp.]
MTLYRLLSQISLAAWLAACSGLSGGHATGTQAGLWLVPVNHTGRHAPQIFVDDTWAGNVGRHGGGGGAVCCIAGRADWSKPVLVQWRWGREEDPVTKAVTLAGEDRSAMVAFPRAPKRLNKPIKEPWSSEDYAADEAYLCVIFRTLDKVELSYATRAGACREK